MIRATRLDRPTKFTAEARQRDRRSIDDFKDEVLRVAGMPIYRIRVQRAYDLIELAKNIDRLIEGR